MNARINLSILLSFFVFLHIQSAAQNTTTCPSDQLNDSLLTHNPGFSRSFFYMEQKLGLQAQIPPADRSDDLYTLPVVVHIIHEGEAYGTGSNITDEQVFSAITALNNDFRHTAGTNGDGAGVDVNIEFCLAQRDPNGQPTTGIVRVNGSSVPLYADQGIESSGGGGAVEESVKALSTWPRASYVNIWVVNEIENNDGGSGIQGYAYFPINNPIDGIVLLHNAFGTVGNLKSYTNMNRTLTHEIGHYLGLYHTFHDTNACGAEANCNTGGDRVCDTPVTTLNSSCSSPACSGTQQVENYLDYTSQTCQDMFTEGQKLRMRTTLEVQRTSMISSLGCQPVFTRDAGISMVTSPSGTNCVGTYTPQVILVNYGSATLTSVTITYNLDGSGNSTYSWTGSLTSGSQATVNLPAITPAIGSHTYYAWTSNPNGQSDQNTANDQSTNTFSITTGAGASLVVTLDFFGGENTWVITDENDNILIEGGPYANNAQGTSITEELCLGAGCYTLTFYDQYGDGMGFTSGGFVLYDGNDNILVQQEDDWGDVSSNPFCLVDIIPSGNPPVASFNIQDNSVCKNVQVDFTSTSTNTPTSYAWTFEGGTPATSAQQNPQNITWATNGTYDIALTATNQYGSHTYTCANCMTVYADPTVTLTPTNPLCNTGTGSIANAVTGSSPFTYAWSNGATTQNLTNANAGSHTVNVTSSQGCAKSQSATLTAPSAIAVTGTATNPSCNTGSNGSIAVSSTGGTGNKTYSWNTGATGATINNLAAGTFTVTATDANGCTKTQAFTLTAPAAIAITGTTTNPSCSTSSNGSIAVSSTGGTGSKTYSWNTGATGASISNLSAGSYTVTATDANGCTKTQSFTITTPAALSVSGTITHPLCNTGSNGSITASATGGTGNKTYSWSNGATGATANNLAAGTYTVTATDANGCTATQQFVLTNPSAITITGTATNATCNATNNGSIVVSATGGTGNKTFSWSNGATGATVSNLAAGGYTVTATDANGCIKTQSFTITSPAAIAVTGTVTNVNCNGQSNGNIVATATGGAGGFSYSWNTGATGATLSNAAAGNYSVVAADVNGCTKTQSFTITAPSILATNLTHADIGCGMTVGSAQVAPAGGTSPYSVSWSNGATGTSISNLVAGNYSVTVTDSHGCTANGNFTIDATASLNVTINGVDVSCNGASDGGATTTITGGNGVFTYLWSNGSTSSMISSLAPGNYSLIVTDGGGCQGTAQVTIDQPTPLALAVFKQDISCFGLNDGTASATASGGIGPYNYAWSNEQDNEVISNLAEGIYTVSVVDDNGCITEENIEIVEPSMLTANVVILTAESCEGNDGSAVVNVMGGSPGYFIIWSDGTTSQTISEAASGDYFVNITDINGCSLQTDVTIPYECITEVPPTQLIDTDCGAMDIPLNGIITCDAVPNAEMYQWRFMNGAGVIISDEYSLGNVFMISQIPGVAEGLTYKVGIKAMVNDVYGPFGDICEIELAGEAPATTTSLDPESCGAVVDTWDTQLNATEIPGALNYQWHITGPDYDWTTYTDVNYLQLNDNMALIAGSTYYVQIRCAMGAGIFTEWGETCTFSIDLGIDIDDFPPLVGYLMIYPNPGTGENIFFDFSNLPNNVSVEDLTIYGTNGNLVERLNVTLTPESQKVIEYRFAQPLAAGVYVLQYKFNGRLSEQKLVVQ
ncbi:MAG: M43 family zinc metalloprotease [Flavobacteriales bacterium]